MTTIQPSPYRHSHIVTDHRSGRRTISVDVAPETFDAFEAIAKRRNISKAALGREAVERLVAGDAG